MPRADTLNFTAHNVRLNDGRTTYPAAGKTIDETGNYLAVKNLLPLLFPDGWQGRSIVDLGCLEGGFAAEFARLGLASTGIEVRQSNLDNAEFLRAELGLSNLKYICDNAWNLGRYGPFDIVFCAGLHYHIEDQRRFLAEMGQACGRALVMDTHIAPEADDHPAVATYRLSPLTEHEGLPGRWYPEHDLDAATDQAALEVLKWASWENRRSFWPTRAALVQSIRDAGFRVVLEDFDQLRDKAVELLAHEGWRWRNARPLFVGLKTPDMGPGAQPPSPEARRLGLLLGRSALRGRTLMLGDDLPEPVRNGHDLVRAQSLADAPGPFADILASGVLEAGAEPQILLGRLAGLVSPGGAVGLRIAERHVAPDGFLDLAEALATRGQFPFRIAAFQAPSPGEDFFLVRLIPADPAVAAPILETIAAARPLLHAAGTWRPAPAPEPSPDPSPETERLAAELAEARAALQAMRASTSWRITAPLRALKVRLSGKGGDHVA